MKTLEYHHFATPAELMAPGSDYQWLLTALLLCSLLPQEPPGNLGWGKQYQECQGPISTVQLLGKLTDK